MKFADLGEVSLRYRVSGDPMGPWIVLANSLGTDLTIWDQVIADLPGGYGVLCYDKRGHGLSSRAGGELRMDDHVDDLLALMDLVGVETCILGGVSVGGLIAQGLAGRAPERVRALILCNTGSKIGPPQMWRDRISGITEQGLEPFADAVMERWFTPGFHRDRGAELSGYRRMLTNTSVEGYTATCAAIRDADLTEGTRALRLPTLCIAGDGDKATPPEMVRALHGLIDGAQYLEIADCGHLPMLEQPGICAAAFRDFLAAVEDTDTPFAPGMAVRRRVLGAAHVDRASAGSPIWTGPFSALSPSAPGAGCGRARISACASAAS